MILVVGEANDAVDAYQVARRAGFFLGFFVR
jgi:hypothetical protein